MKSTKDSLNLKDTSKSSLGIETSGKVEEVKPPVVGNGRKRLDFMNRRFFAIVVIILITIMGLVGAYMLYLDRRPVAAPTGLTNLGGDLSNGQPVVQKDTKASIESLKAQVASEKNPIKKSELAYQVGTLSMEEDNYVQAQEYLTQSIKNDPSREQEYLSAIAVTQYNLGKKDEAIASYKKLLAIYENTSTNDGAFSQLIEKTKSTIATLESGGEL